MKRGIGIGAALAAVMAMACQTAPPKKQAAPQPKPTVQTVELRHVVVPARPAPAAKAPAQVAAVGKVAPDFTLPAYYKGKFVTETLSKHRGKWVVLCFYPGDFTFV